MSSTLLLRRLRRARAGDGGRLSRRAIVRASSHATRGHRLCRRASTTAFLDGDDGESAMAGTRGARGSTRCPLGRAREIWRRDPRSFMSHVTGQRIDATRARAVSPVSSYVVLLAGAGGRDAPPRPPILPATKAAGTRRTAAAPPAPRRDLPRRGLRTGVSPRQRSAGCCRSHLRRYRIIGPEQIGVRGSATSRRTCRAPSGRPGSDYESRRKLPQRRSFEIGGTCEA